MEGEHSREELQVGDLVLVDLPQCRWDHRKGILCEIRHEPGEPSQGLVYLSWMLVRFPLQYLVKSVPNR